MEFIRLRTRWIREALSIIGRRLPGGNREQGATSRDVAIGISDGYVATGTVAPKKYWSVVQRQWEPELVNAVRDGFSAAEWLSKLEPLGRQRK